VSLMAFVICDRAADLLSPAQHQQLP
jgi:hypothetical protein